jgi:hypothetical protein
LPAVVATAPVHPVCHEPILSAGCRCCHWRPPCVCLFSGVDDNKPRLPKQSTLRQQQEAASAARLLPTSIWVKRRVGSSIPHTCSIHSSSRRGGRQMLEGLLLVTTRMASGPMLRRLLLVVPADFNNELRASAVRRDHRQPRGTVKHHGCWAASTDAEGKDRDLSAQSLSHLTPGTAEIDRREYDQRSPCMALLSSLLACACSSNAMKKGHKHSVTASSSRREWASIPSPERTAWAHWALEEADLGGGSGTVEHGRASGAASGGACGSAGASGSGSSLFAVFALLANALGGAEGSGSCKRGSRSWW